MISSFQFDLTDPLELSLFNRKKAISEDDYDAFTDQLNKDVEFQLYELTSNANHWHEAGEDQITTCLVGALKAMGYNASHDSNHNGHVDINIQYGNFKWLGECKLQKGDENTYKGFNQLTTRYSRGNDYEYRGGIIVYHQNPHKTALDSLQGWRDYIRSIKDPVIHCSNIPNRKLYFDSTHRHIYSGYDYCIRHFWVNIAHNPKV